jgi:murein DD-endopeptidase MepM/ murein hydrolase activator NlpD
MKTVRRVCSMAFALLLVCSLIYTAVTPAYGSLQDDLAQSQAKIDEYEKQIKEAQASKEDALAQKAIYDAEVDALNAQISLLQGQIDATTAQIAANEAKEKDQYALFCKQVREEEERGSISYWSVLFNATSFADLLSRVDFVSEIMAYDRQVINDLRTTREQLATDKAALEEQKSQQSTAQAAVQTKADEANELVKQFAATEAGAQAMQDEEQSALAEIEEAIRASQYVPPTPSGGGGASVGGYIWPTDCRYITSLFGYRSPESTNGIGSTNHSGVDIDASSGDSIYATKAGTVVLACYNGGFGNCVVIQHGNGNRTLYGHMSKILVSAGQTVAQGEVIGLVGSTGNSTGAHLHYTVYENNVLVDPLQYLPGANLTYAS